MNLQLNSVCGPDATTGTLMAAARVFHTIELPWAHNLADKSCVPAGDYELIPYCSPKHGDTWRLHNPTLGIYGHGIASEGMRTEIEIHSGNWARESLGCLLVGVAASWMIDPRSGLNAPVISSSREAIANLLFVLGRLSNGHTLTIARNGAYP